LLILGSSADVFKARLTQPSQLGALLRRYDVAAVRKK